MIYAYMYCIYVCKYVSMYLYICSFVSVIECYIYVRLHMHKFL